MCGRYASARKRQELLEEFQVERDRVTESLPPDYNVAPTKPVYAVVTRLEKPEKPESGAREPSAAEPSAAEPSAAEPSAAETRGAETRGAETSGAPPDAAAVRELRVVRWGLVPFWAKDVKIGSRLINARAETVSTKPAFRRAFARRRCLLPADGFYEWQAAGARKDDPSARSDRPGAHKQPYFIHRADGGVLAFAGIYELWRDDAAGDGDPDAWLWTAAIITTQAQDDLGQIHDRMPMVVEPGRWSEWLDPTQADEAKLHALLAPAASGGLSSYPVSTEVNAVRNNGPGLIEPADRERGDASNGTAGKLF
jgi:putative SOS response-associated peptidase YedK